MTRQAAAESRSEEDELIGKQEGAEINQKLESWIVVKSALAGNDGFDSPGVFVSGFNG